MCASLQPQSLFLHDICYFLPWTAPNFVSMDFHPYSCISLRTETTSTDMHHKHSQNTQILRFNVVSRNYEHHRRSTGSFCHSSSCRWASDRTTERFGLHCSHCGSLGCWINACTGRIQMALTSSWDAICFDQGFSWWFPEEIMWDEFPLPLEDPDLVIASLDVWMSYFDSFLHKSLA